MSQDQARAWWHNFASPNGRHPIRVLVNKSTRVDDDEETFRQAEIDRQQRDIQEYYKAMVELAKQKEEQSKKK